MKYQKKITILGTALSIQSDDGEEHLEAVLRYFTEKVKHLQDSPASAEPVKIAILAGLNAVDELLKLKRKVLSNTPEDMIIKQEIEERTGNMIREIDKAISE
ncbi:MAG: cell division protein ZapA [Spirochaetales bacterium]|nr:cell division protein ZapA [Spirochaetales bacterium]